MERRPFVHPHVGLDLFVSGIQLRVGRSLTGFEAVGVVCVSIRRHRSHSGWAITRLLVFPSFADVFIVELGHEDCAVVGWSPHSVSRSIFPPQANDHPP